VGASTLFEDRTKNLETSLLVVLLFINSEDELQKIVKSKSHEHCHLSHRSFLMATMCLPTLRLDAPDSTSFQFGGQDR